LLGPFSQLPFLKTPNCRSDQFQKITSTQQFKNFWKVNEMKIEDSECISYHAENNAIVHSLPAHHSLESSYNLTKSF